jgi:hypothetical protein
MVRNNSLLNGKKKKPACFHNAGPFSEQIDKD